MKRLPAESFAAYKARRKAAQVMPKPRLLWDSARRGTYVRAKHGNLGGRN